MAIKKTRFRPKGNDNYETIIHFETSADIVKTTDDSNVQSKLDELKNNYNNILNDIEDIQSELNSKETPSGAQAKANQALNDAKSYTDNKVAELVSSAPETLDTLNELAEALGKDPNFATTITTELGKKASKTDLDSHKNNESNPHNVTKSQVGLGNVDNVKQASKSEFDSHVNTQASTSTTGHVKLTSSVDSTSTTLGATASAVKQAYDKAKSVETEVNKLKEIKTATIGTSWSGSSPPYTQEITVSGITSNDYPIISPVYSSNLNTAIAQNEAWNMISKIETGTDKLIVTCFEDKPTVEIPIQIKGV